MSHRRGPKSPSVPSQGAHNTQGSVVVMALSLGVVATIVIGAATARIIAAADASRGLHEREMARSLAEHGAVVAIAELDAGGAAAAVVEGIAFRRAVAVDVDGWSVDAGTESGLDVEVSAEDPRQRILIRSVAVVGRARHVVTTEVRPRATSDHLLLTVHEVVDPALRAQRRGDCAGRRGDAARSSACLPTTLGPGVIDGPVHSDDAIEIAPGTEFLSSVTTSHLDVLSGGRIGPSLWGAVGPLISAPFGLAHRPESTLPFEVEDAIAGESVTCRFRGPTLLRFDGQRVRITSPRSVPRDGDDVAAAPVFGCPGVDPTALSGVVEAHLPPRALIVVVRDRIHDCVDHPLGLPHGEDTERDWWCSGGDAFVWGRYRGVHTVVAQDNVQIVWDLEPGDAVSADSEHGANLLGIVAGDSIVLRRPVGRPNRRDAPFGPNIAFAGPGIAPFGSHPLDAPNAAAMTWAAPTIVASLAALRGSITIQNPFRGKAHPGPVTIRGALAMRFRGVFAWEERNDSGSLLGEMGYGLDLRYDRRLVTLSPPAMPLTAGGTVRIVSVDLGSG